MCGNSNEYKRSSVGYTQPAPELSCTYKLGQTQSSVQALLCRLQLLEGSISRLSIDALLSPLDEVWPELHARDDA